MKKMKKITMALLLVLTMGMLSACGAKFDASGYVKSVLDASYKGEFEEYCKLTNSEEADAEKMYNENIDNMMEEFESIGLSEELQAQYRDLFTSLMKEVKYSVGEAKEDENKNFTVEVTVEKVKFFEGALEEYQDELNAYQEELQKEISNGGSIPTEDELVEKAGSILYDILAKRAANIEYGESQTITVHVTKDSKNVYSVNEADLTKIDEATYDVDKL